MHLTFSGQTPSVYLCYLNVLIIYLVFKLWYSSSPWYTLLPRLLVSFFPFGLWNFSFNFNLNLIFSLFQPLHRISFPCPLVYLGAMWFRTCHQTVHFYLLQIHTETCIIFDFIEQSYSHFEPITINKAARKYVTLYRSVYNFLRSYCNMHILIF